MGPLAALLLAAAGITAFILVVIFVMVPLFKGIGWMIAGFFRAIGWIVMHLFEFVAGMIGDTLRLVGSVIAAVVLVPVTMLNVVIGRWSAAGHFAGSVQRELKVAGTSIYRLLVQRPLRLVMLHGLLEGIEQRVPEAMAAAPSADKPRRRVGQFDGYSIVGSLPGGGSGAKLYIATPDPARHRKPMPERVVIKSFALTEGSSLPQIVRESRALESAKQLGLVLDHHMDEHRFFYVMPYHAGDHLGIVTRQLHGEAGGDGLREPQLRQAMGYAADLLTTLSTYHRGGLWHKDIKPENVIVRDGQAHVVDLGLVTPLRSAMTLTTHGTEYFRDPEMVRQALRGVKVHQVDGARFDIYAVGAVLYFMIENTFPAHGGLSRFSRRSPEALRWVVRRAMADYNQRYESADIMLADLQRVLESDDVFAARPADLPSVRGGAAPAESVHARTPVPPPLPDEALPTPEAAPVAAAVAAAGAAAAAAGAAAAGAVKAAAPRLKVVNWWSGAYKVEDADLAMPPTPAANPPHHPPHNEARHLRAQAQDFRQDMAHLRSQVAAGAMSARRAAREQVRTARQRAREVRRRAAAHRREITSARGPSPFLAFLTVFIIGLGLLGGVALYGKARHEASAVSHTTVIVTGSEDDGGIPILLVSDVTAPAAPEIAEAVAGIIDHHLQKGYEVIETVPDPEVFVLFGQWLEDPSGPADDRLEDYLEIHDLYGLLHVFPSDHGHDAVSSKVIRSTRDGADERRRHGDAFAFDSSLPLLLLNDHPTKADPRVAERVAEIEAVCRERGWILITDDDAEVAVRKMMPPAPHDPAAALPPRLNSYLVDSGLAGILRISAPSGDAPAHERVGMTLIPARF